MIAMKQYFTEEDVAAGTELSQGSAPLDANAADTSTDLSIDIGNYFIVA